MTDREVMQQALEQALEALNLPSMKTMQMLRQRDEAITALRAALEQPEQEPVALMFQHEETGRTAFIEISEHKNGWKPSSSRMKLIGPLYTAPPQQQAEPVHGDIRALKYRIHELEGEVIGYKRMLDVAEAPPQRKPLTTENRSAIVNDALRGHASTRDAIDWAIQHVERHHGIKEKT